MPGKERLPPEGRIFHRYFLRYFLIIFLLVFCTATRLLDVVGKEGAGTVSLSDEESWGGISSVEAGSGWSKVSKREGGLSLGGFRPNSACTSSQSPTMLISTLSVANACSITDA